MPSIVDPTQHPEPDEAHHCQLCQFTGSLTREHIWPWVLRKHFPEITRARHERGHTGKPQGKLARDTWQAPPFTASARIDCHRCNHNRLAKIENEAIPLVVPMVRGTGGFPLPLTAQRKLAAFAIRMIAVGQYTHPSQRPVIRAHREHLSAQLSPPPRMEVWAMCAERCSLTDTVHLQAASFQFAGPGETFPHWANAYRGILRFGHLVLEIAALHDGRA